jgi:transglutaminase-like putative cysteine protease
MPKSYEAKTMIAPKYLTPTAILDSDHPAIMDYARNVTRRTGNDPVSQAAALYLAVRDGIWYDPYVPFHRDIDYRASRVLASGRGFCVSKAALLCALARACAIPSRLGFATVRNHLATRQLIEHLGCDLFVYHGFTEFFLNDCWIKATPAFNAELCRRHQVAPLEFDGRRDSIFQPYNSANRPFMEYVSYHPSCADVPVKTILAEWENVYGKDRVQGWIEILEQSGDPSSPRPIRNFDTEEILVGDTDAYRR